jgi:Ca2+-binding RTX toxin-like protein
MSDPYTDLGVVIVSSDSIIEGTDGRDTLIAAGGDTTLRGGWGDDTLVGGSGNDSLEGGRISLFNHPDSNLMSVATATTPCEGISAMTRCSATMAMMC